MLKINVEVNQLKTYHSIEVQTNQKGTNILQLLFNKLDLDQEIRKSIQCVLKVENTKVDPNLTISALEIHTYSQVQVVFSKLITIECDHQHLGLIKFDTEAFDSINQFRSHLITNLVKIKSCEILVFNLQNGTKFENEAWAKYGVFNNLKVGLQITNVQKFKFNDTIHQLKLDVFLPVAKIIVYFKNEFKINDDIITFKQNDLWITPDKIYYQLKPDGENIWFAEVQKEFNFKINEEPQEAKQIKIHKDKGVFDLIRIVREIFKIEKTIPIKLEYKMNNNFLDINNLLKQEWIQTFSHLHLTRDTSDNKINIMLLDKSTHKKQIERVDVNSTLADLDKFISPNENISYYVGDDKKPRTRTLSLNTLDLQSESVIHYQITINQDNRQHSFGFDVQKNSQYIEQYSQIHQPSEETLNIKFTNKNTKISVDVPVDSSTTVGEALQKIIMNETFSELRFYKVLFNNEKVEMNTKFESLNISTNYLLLYFTEFIKVQAYVEQIVQTITIDQNSSINQLEQQFRTELKIDNSLYLELSSSENKNQKLKDFLIKNPNYKFEFKKKQEVIAQTKPQIKQLEFSVFIVSLNTQKQIMVQQNSVCQSLFDKIKYQYNLPKNQVIKLMVGDKLIDPKETIVNISNLIIQTKKQLTAEFLTYLELDFENLTTKHTQKVQANLEDTLEQVACQNKMIGWTFTCQQNKLDVSNQIKDQPIENNSKIQYQEKLITFESSRSGQKYEVKVQPEDTLNILIDRLDVQIHKIYHRDDALELTTKIKNIDLSSGDKLIFDDKEDLNQPSGNFSDVYEKYSVKVQVGERELTYLSHPNLIIGILKQTIYNQMIKDQGIEISKYCLMQNGLVLDDQQIISNLCKNNLVELVFALNQTQ